MASQLVIRGGGEGLVGSVPVPGDEQIALCRAALAILSRGTTTLEIRDSYGGLAVLVESFRALGATVRAESGRVVVEGTGLFGLRAPEDVLDARGEAPVGAFLFALLVSRPFASEIWVDGVVAELLAPVFAHGHDFKWSPLDESGAARIRIPKSRDGFRGAGVEAVTAGVFPWVKQAVLLAGLRGSSVSAVEEKLASADHMERAFLKARMPIDAEATFMEIHPPRDEDASAPQTYREIGSSALVSPLASLALLRGKAQLTVREVGLNPTRSDFLTATRLMGAEVSVSPKGDRENEPFGDVNFRGAANRPFHCGGELAVRLSDEVFYLMALATGARGTSSFEDIVPGARGGDPRIVGRVVGLLRSSGADVETDGGRVSVRGAAALKPLSVTTGGDGRLALVASILAAKASGTSTIDDVDCLRQVFPRWVGTLRALGVNVQVKTV